MFLKLRGRFFERAQAADPSIDLNELLTESLVVSKLRHLTLRLGDRRGTRERLADSFAFDLVSQPVSWAMRGLVGLVATTIRFATAAGCSRDRTRTEIAQIGQLTRKERGFTLIELLFALALLAAIGVTGGSQAVHQPGGAGDLSSVQWSGSGRR